MNCDYGRLKLGTRGSQMDQSKGGRWEAKELEPTEPKGKARYN